MTRLGKEIKKARIEKSLLQSQLGAVAGIDHRHVSAIERGTIDPRWTTLVKIVRALEPYLCLDRVISNMELDEQGLFYKEDARYG